MDDRTLKILRDAFNEQALAHLCIDTQFVFYNALRAPNRLAYQNAANLASFCRHAAIPNIFVAMTRQNPPHQMERFHIAAPVAGEAVFFKKRQSAFSNETMHDNLKKQGFRILLVSGVHARACVHETIRDALMHHYGVIAVVDAINLDPQTAEQAEKLYGHGVRALDVKTIRLALGG